jgi:EAL domain-containing protein (putative c-di-GMP-specific phosphodiesterase class I)
LHEGTPSAPAPKQEEVTAATLLQKLVAQGRLSVDFQPLVDVRTQQAVAVEIFMHWQHPDAGVLRTTEQLQARPRLRPLSDEAALWVVENAFQQHAAWHNMELPVLPILINLSALSMNRERLLARLRELLALHRLPPGQFVLGYSETDYIRMQPDPAWLQALRALGVRLCLDNPGSITAEALTRLDLDLLRLTPGATAGLPASPEAMTESRRIITLAQQVGVPVVACNIERTDQMAALTALGCHVFQGRLVGEMMTTRETARYLARTEVGSL